ncbi:MAG TPA: hypothetical protein VGJ28_27430, partial [Micromonosporaceae bacterium]
AVVDVLRLIDGVPYVGWLNLVFVWGLAHMAGFHHERLMSVDRRTGGALAAAGLIGLIGLVALGYPGSMVGVPGEKWSNMSPPTLAIVALTLMQIGLIRLGAPSITRFLNRPLPRRVLDVANRFGMPVYLYHLSAFLIAQAVGWPAALCVLVALLATTGRRRPATETAQRPAPRLAWLAGSRPMRRARLSMTRRWSAKLMPK